MIAKARQHEMKFTTLKYVGYGGAPCPMAVALEMKEVFNVKRLVVSIEVFLKQWTDCDVETCSMVGWLAYAACYLYIRWLQFLLFNDVAV